MISIAREIFKAKDIDVDYKVIPWAEAITRSRNGEFDGITGALHADAPDFIFPDSPQGMSAMRFWVLKDSDWKFDGVDSLKSIKLGIVADYAYGEPLDSFIKTYKDQPQRISIAQGVNALNDNLQKLQNKEIDAMAEDENVVDYYLAAHSTEYAVKEVGTPVANIRSSDNFLYIAFSPKNPKSAYYASVLNAGMKQLRDSGELQKILDVYQVRDWYAITGK